MIKSMLRVGQLFPESETSLPESVPSSQEVSALVALFSKGRYADAGRLAQAMIESFPQCALGWKIRGSVLKLSGQSAEALQSLLKATTLSPDDAETRSNLGNVLKDLGRFKDAAASHRMALAIAPDFLEAHGNLGNTLKELGQFDDALAAHRRALAVEPHFSAVLSNLGNTLKNLRRFADAVPSYYRSLALKPDSPQVLSNLGNTLKDLGRLKEASGCFGRALVIDPDYDEPRWNRGLMHLSLGQFQSGWQAYETRWNLKETRCLPEPYPCWLGREDIAGKDLLIQYEQGLGDAIQMLRYVPLLERMNVKCWIQVPNSLQRLIARSFPRARVIEPHLCPEGLDYRVPVMSLPLAMQTFSERSIPRSIPYLTPNAERVVYWGKQLALTGPLSVGLVWRGNPKQKNDPNRSAKLADFLPLIAAHESVRFVTLQKDLMHDERNALLNFDNVRILDGELTDLDETAAVMCHMDIVISVCTGTAHLAGALGRSTWILLWFGGDWRWLIGREDSPWYPTARLFRQKCIGEWAGAIVDLENSLQVRLKMRSVIQAGANS